MGINMRISPVSFSSQTPKVNNRQDFETLRDKALDRQLEELLPMFLDGDADVVFISTTVTPDRELKMDVKVEKMEPLNLGKEAVNTKETLWDKLKKIFKK